MPDQEKVIKGLECAIGIRGRKNCDACPYDNDFNCVGCDIVMRDALALLKEQEKELTRDDLDTLVDMISQKAKSDGRFFSPYEVGLALVAHGQHDERFRWGEVIKYSPSEVEQILNEVMQDGIQ